MGGDRVPGPFDDAVDEETRRRREWLERHRDGFPHARAAQELLERARDEYKLEFCRLDRIAYAVFHGRRGGFIKKYVDAWMNADVWNKRLMRPVFESFVRKYGLEKDPKGLGGENRRSDL